MITTAEYARRMAERYLRSLEHYGDTSPPVGDGRVSTPAYYAGRLARAAYVLGFTMPGDASIWWGTRHRMLAVEILDSPRWQSRD